MYAGTGEGYYNGDSIRGAGIFKSTDGGTTWSQLASSTASSFWQVNRLAMSPDGRVLLAATRSGLFRSTDGGATFTPVGGANCGDVDFHPTDSTRAIAAGWGEIVYSVDGGVSWQTAAGVPANAGRIEMAYSRSQPGVVYASAELDGGSLFRSGSGGATFSLVSGGGLLGGQGWYDDALWVSPIDSNHVIVGGIGLHQSFDGGSSWTDITAYIHPDHHIIVADPRYNGTTNRRLFFGGDGGVTAADDIAAVSTTGFRSLNNNLGVTQFYGGAGNPATGVIVGGAQDNGTVVKSTASGTSWVQTLGSDGGFAAADPTDPSYFYTETIYLGIYRSSNGGNGWNFIASGITDAGANTLFIAPFILDPNNSNRMLAGGASLWRSNNVKAAAPVWTAIQGGSSEHVSAIAVAAGNSDVLWVGRSYGRVYKSVNGTASAPVFTAMAVPTAAMVTRIAIHPFDSNIVYVTTGGFGPANILRTLDGGATWSAATGSGSTALPEVPVNDLEIDAASPDTIYAATEVGVFVSADGGAHWELPQDGPANVCVDELFWMGSTLVAATHGRGMFSVETRPSGTPALSISPTAIDFGTQTVGSTSAARRVVVTNSGTAPLIVNGTTISGANPGDWPGLTGTCMQTTIPAGGTCWIDVAFRPGASGARSGEIVLTTNPATSPDSIFLRGSGVAPPAALPSPWISRDLGATGVVGSASYANGVFSIYGAGADIWGTADAFQFVYRTMLGDGSIVARLADVENVYAWTKAGLMIRADTAAGAENAALFVTPARGITFQSRNAAGTVTTSVVTAGTAPQWLKLVRAGSTITAFISVDGTTWTSAGKATIALGSNVLVGLAVTSHNVGRTARATFDSVAVTPAAVIPSLPASWATRDIGAVGQTGSAAEASGVFTVTGAGADIWNTADAFRYAYVPLAGDGSVVARVAEVQNVNAWTKAGVMIRQTVDAASVHASMFVTPGNGLSFQRRTASGGTTTATTVSGAAPRWVRLTRSGQLFTASVSLDGTLWTNVGQATIAVSGTVWAGLAVSSHTTAQTATAKLDHVAVTAAPSLGTGWQNADVGAVAIKGSASLSGATLSLSGAGADIWGTADAYQMAYKTLSGDGQLVARVTTIDNTHRWAKAGVMVRANLTAGAPYAMMLVSAGAGSSFQWRSASGGSSSSVSGGTAVVAPEWVKIVRAGNVLTGYQSADGVSWTSIGSTTVSMGPSAYIGLAITSHDNTKLAKATFESVR
jgi:regulation of enolase protein 1 (concanavalin A-like superfamily)